MRTFEEYMLLPYTVIIKPSPEGGYVAKIAELPGCITQGETLHEVTEMIEDAKAAWIDIAMQDGKEIPEPVNEEYSGRFNVRIPKTLHKALVKQAKEEEVSLNQLTTYLLSAGIGKKSAKKY
jgi:antitoxin HicB